MRDRYAVEKRSRSRPMGSARSGGQRVVTLHAARPARPAWSPRVSAAARRSDAARCPGATLGNAGMIELATWFTTANGIIVTSIANALLALLILASGFKNYVRLQRVMWIATLLAFGTMLVVLFTTNAADVPGALNAFSTSIGGNRTFYQDAVAATTAAGVDTNPPFSLLATLLIAPIAWTSLQWATYSTQQNGEIKDARSFRNQAMIIVGALVVTGILLATP